MTDPLLGYMAKDKGYRSIEQIQMDIQHNGPVPDDQGDAVRAEIVRANFTSRIDDAETQALLLVNADENSAGIAVIVVELDDAEHLVETTAALTEYIAMWRKDPDFSHIVGMHMAIKETAEAILNRLRLGQ